ncbi:MAG: hypothetical protein ACYC2U_08805 [Candidatus Amoebophilus sp.]
MCNIYWNSIIAGSYLCSKTCQIKYPETDILFVNKDDYDFVRWDLLGRAAWYAKELEISQNTVCSVLRRIKNRGFDKDKEQYEYLWHNLNCYLAEPLA